MLKDQKAALDEQLSESKLRAFEDRLFQLLDLNRSVVNEAEAEARKGRALFRFIADGVDNDFAGGESKTVIDLEKLFAHFTNSSRPQIEVFIGTTQSIPRKS